VSIQEIRHLLGTAAYVTSLPFRIRSKGLMVFQVMVSLSLVFNQFVNPVALAAIQWRYYIVYTVWLAFE
jgi:hypothetical protein